MEAKLSSHRIEPLCLSGSDVVHRCCAKPGDDVPGGICLSHEDARKQFPDVTHHRPTSPVHVLMT